MWLHQHPYAPWIPKNATRLLVGTLPPPRFSLGQLKTGDVNFCYGSSDGLLWKIFDVLFDLQLEYADTPKAVAQRKAFLTQQRLGICDVVDCCYREKIDASDSGMTQVQLRDMFSYFQAYPSLRYLIFTGGNSKNGPEYFFRSYVKAKGIAFTPTVTTVPRQHQFEFGEKRITTFSLTAPSGSANRAIGSMPYYKYQKQQNPSYTTFDFRLEQYAKVLQATSV